jgi:hypothetical protein
MNMNYLVFWGSSDYTADDPVHLNDIEPVRKNGRLEGGRSVSQPAPQCLKRDSLSARHQQGDLAQGRAMVETARC